MCYWQRILGRGLLRHMHVFCVWNAWPASGKKHKGKKIKGNEIIYFEGGQLCVIMVKLINSLGKVQEDFTWRQLGTERWSDCFLLIMRSPFGCKIPCFLDCFPGENIETLWEMNLQNEKGEEGALLNQIRPLLHFHPSKEDKNLLLFWEWGTEGDVILHGPKMIHPN